MMSARTRHEAQIKHYDTRFGREFENALYSVIQDYGGLSFFTDEQVEEIRAAMIKAEWKHRCQKNEMRARNLAALQSHQPKKETV
jgi:hypothetical protein